ncbi:unnamed protein product [Spodoptera exigua]|nr:unnamed protein product [Spodoptera exigua]
MAVVTCVQTIRGKRTPKVQSLIGLEAHRVLLGDWASGRAGERASGRAGERASGRAGERASGRAGERASGRAGRAALQSVPSVGLPALRHGGELAGSCSVRHVMRQE